MHEETLQTSVESLKKQLDVLSRGRRDKYGELMARSQASLTLKQLPTQTMEDETENNAEDLAGGKMNRSTQEILSMLRSPNDPGCSQATITTQYERSTSSSMTAGTACGSLAGPMGSQALASCSNEFAPSSRGTDPRDTESQHLGQEFDLGYSLHAGTQIELVQHPTDKACILDSGQDSSTAEISSRVTPEVCVKGAVPPFASCSSEVAASAVIGHTQRGESVKHTTAASHAVQDKPSRAVSDLFGGDEQQESGGAFNVARPSDTQVFDSLTQHEAMSAPIRANSNTTEAATHTAPDGCVPQSWHVDGIAGLFGNEDQQKTFALHGTELSGLFQAGSVTQPEATAMACPSATDAPHGDQDGNDFPGIAQSGPPNDQCELDTQIGQSMAEVTKPSKWPQSHHQPSMEFLATAQAGTLVLESGADPPAVASFIGATSGSCQGGVSDLFDGAGAAAEGWLQIAGSTSGDDTTIASSLPTAGSMKLQAAPGVETVAASWEGEGSESWRDGHRIGSTGVVVGSAATSELKDASSHSAGVSVCPPNNMPASFLSSLPGDGSESLTLEDRVASDPFECGTASSAARDVSNLFDQSRLGPLSEAQGLSGGQFGVGAGASPRCDAIGASALNPSPVPGLQECSPQPGDQGALGAAIPATGMASGAVADTSGLFGNDLAPSSFFDSFGPSACVGVGHVDLPMPASAEPIAQPISGARTTLTAHSGAPSHAEVSNLFANPTSGAGKDVSSLF